MGWEEVRYGCIGEHLGHSFSREIHTMLGDYDYRLCELAPEEVESFLLAKKFCGINVTIPYKQTVIPYLDEVDPAARRIGAVNTVLHKNGKLIGYNTDYYGIAFAGRHRSARTTGRDSRERRNQCDCVGCGTGCGRRGDCACVQASEKRRQRDRIRGTVPAGGPDRRDYQYDTGGNVPARGGIGSGSDGVCTSVRRCGRCISSALHESGMPRRGNGNSGNRRVIYAGGAGGKGGGVVF